MEPGEYQSDFEKSYIRGKKLSENDYRFFQDRNNSLNGQSKKNDYYRTSKTGVCVTVGMMQGYDCKDLLNICLMRPVTRLVF